MIDSVSPRGGPLAGGNTVTITGSGFENDGLTLDTVDFVPAGLGTNAIVVSDTEITATAPDATTDAAGAPTLAGDIEVTFTNPADPTNPVMATDSATGVSDYTFGAPVIDSVSPPAGPLAGGNTVTITGVGFKNDGLTLENVDFVPAGLGTNATVVSDTEITATAPDATTDSAGAATLAGDIEVAFTNPSDPTVPVMAIDSATGVSDYVFGAPVIESVSPVAGPLAGGDAVTITGSGFEAAGLTLDTVGFDPSSDTNGSKVMDGIVPIVDSDTQITVTAPDATTAANGKATLKTVVKVLFTDSADPSVPVKAVPAQEGLNLYDFGTPVVDSISPPAGPLGGGNTVTIMGKGFDDAGLVFDKVVFNPLDGSLQTLDGIGATVVSDTEITLAVPDGTAAANGKATLQSTVDVSFVDPADPGTSVVAVNEAGNTFYSFGTPVIDSLSPSGGPLAGGNTVTITGSGFKDAGLTLDTVKFDPTSDTNDSQAIDGIGATVVSDTEITVTAPDATTAAKGKATLQSVVDVSFTDPADPGTPVGAIDAIEGDSNYNFGTPVVDSISPPAGPLAGGNTVTITGKGFKTSGLTFDKVVFDPLNGSLQTLDGIGATVVSDTAITVTVPDGTTVAKGKATLQSTVDVSFTDPADPSTPVVAVNSAGSTFYSFGTPVIDSLSPPAGPLKGGNTVTITGSGFINAGLTLDTVKFDPVGDTNESQAITATGGTVVSDTEITVTVPDATSAASGTSTVQSVIDVSFIDPADPGKPVGAVDDIKGASDYIFATPEITAVDPIGGPLAGANQLTITGSGFEDPGLTLNGVFFDPAGDTGTQGIEGTGATVVSNTEITVTAPNATAAAAGAPDLATDVSIAFDDPSDPGNLIASDPATASDNGYLFGAPVIDSISPPAGPLKGGNTVTITGSGFKDSGLTLDHAYFIPDGDSTSLDGTNVVVVSDTELTLTAPDATSAANGTSTVHAAAGIDFTDAASPGTPIVAIDGSVGASAYIFATPQITAVDPTGGPLTGRTR